jgi:hypothetical protein
MLTRTPLCIAPALFAIYLPMCAPRVQPTKAPWDAHMPELWQKPVNLPDRDLYHGPWGAKHAPDPQAVYTFVAAKQRGTNPGVVVSDPEGREWHVKQPPLTDRGAEGPTEVVLSRVLSAVGYHQPPVYFLPSFTIRDETGVHIAPGGRFRLELRGLEHTGEWSWQQNPFVGTKPYQGLLVILMMFDSSDLKNANNSLYDLTTPNGPERWYVVRDLGASLGETGRLHPKRGDIDLFERLPFITGVKQGFARFAYDGWHQELIDRRITPEDIEWACDLLAGVSRAQWLDAFRAGGYSPEIADRFTRRVLQRIDEGQRVVTTEAQRTLMARRPASSR